MYNSVKHSLKYTVLVDGTEDNGALFDVEFEVEVFPTTTPSATVFVACSFNFKWT